MIWETNLWYASPGEGKYIFPSIVSRSYISFFDKLFSETSLTGITKDSSNYKCVIIKDWQGLSTNTSLFKIVVIELWIANTMFSYISNSM